MGERRTTDREPPGGGRFDQEGDATRRTRLANERTYLAWWRSGLTSLAVSLAAGRLLPELAGGPQWPYVVLGAGYAVLGLLFIGYGFRRLRRVEAAVRRGEYERPDERAMAVLTAFGVVLGVLTLVLVVVET
ncbi:MAG: DUF202 domain-containing protein [Thermoleophilia bacterium]